MSCRAFFRAGTVGSRDRVGSAGSSGLGQRGHMVTACLTLEDAPKLFQSSGTIFLPSHRHRVRLLFPHVAITVDLGNHARSAFLFVLESGEAPRGPSDRLMSRVQTAAQPLSSHLVPEKSRACRGSSSGQRAAGVLARPHRTSRRYQPCSTLQQAGQTDARTANLFS